MSHPVVLIAGGIGVTPYLSMVRLITDRGHQFPLTVTLLYANRSKESAAYLSELESVTKENSNFIIKNKFGQIDKEFILSSVKDLHSSVWYIAGPPDMVYNARNILFLLGVDEATVYHEEFIGY